MSNGTVLAKGTRLAQVTRLADTAFAERLALWATPAVGHTAAMPPTTHPRFLLNDPAATDRLAGAVQRLARAGDAILLEGNLGAGKSAFARAFLRAAAGDDTLEVPSPTFTLVQSYDTAIGPVHHFDLWRLDGPHALEELAWEDALAGIVLVEWPERLEHLRPADALIVRLSMRSGDARVAELDGWPDRMPVLLAAVEGWAGVTHAGSDSR